ncbi:MAG: NAD(P)-dependent oxidoreductase [Acidimicrobiales bacterium]
MSAASPTPARVVLAEPLHYSPIARAILEALGPVVEGPFDRQGLLGAVADATVLVVRLGHQIDAEVIAAAPALRAIGSPTTGTDHIDLEEAAARGVRVVTLRGETEFLSTIRATPEHTWALLLALARKLPAAAVTAPWDRDAFRGVELAGKRLGIFGLGRVGRIVASYATAFQMSVFAYDTADVAAPGVTMLPSLDALLRTADVLLVHVPLDASTHRAIGAAELRLLPAGALVVNTARGAILDELAVVEALRDGHLAGVAVDVLDGERSPGGPAEGPLAQYAAHHPDRAIVTPHIAGATWESMHRTEVFLAERLRDLISTGS